MLKPLIKKQLLELNTFYFINRRTGKRRSVIGIVAMAGLFLFVFASLAFTFVGFSLLMTELLKDEDSAWVYYSVLGLTSVIVGVFGSVFNTFAGMYKSKDNELLLSMPLKTSDILLSRLAGVLLMSLLYTSIVWVPSIIVPVAIEVQTFKQIIIPLFLTPVIGIMVSVFACVLGWLVAVISSKLKSKSYLITVISLLLFFTYYFLCLKLNTVLTDLVVNAGKIGDKIKFFTYPLYLLGKASCSDLLSLFLFIVFCSVVSYACWRILNTNFFKIVSQNKGEEKKEYVEKRVRKQSVSSALLRREFKGFINNPTYCLNSGLGVPLMIIASVVLLLKRSMFSDMISQLPQELEIVKQMMPLFVTSACVVITSMDGITAPSVSLEGKNVWVLQTLPVNTWEVLHAKERLHVYINSVGLILTLVMGFVFDIPFNELALSMVIVWLCIWLMADLGLFFNLLNPIMNWTNVVVPVKQSMSVLFVILSGLAIGTVILAGYYLLRNTLSVEAYQVVCIMVVLLLYKTVNRWLRTTGCRIFTSL